LKRTPAAASNIAAVRWEVVPIPWFATLTAPGCAFARVTSSERLRTPSFADTSTTFGDVAMTVTAFSCAGS